LSSTGYGGTTYSGPGYNVSYSGGAYGGTTYQPGGYNYGGYQSFGYKWTPYVSRTQNATSEVTFHLLLDPKTIFEGETVRITGNLPVLSEFGDGNQISLVKTYISTYNCDSYMRVEL
jgi:hypothetical protein